MKLLQTLTLGTTRQPPGPEVSAYLELRDAVDPTADDAEKTLAAWAIQERLQRLRTETTEAPKTSAAIQEDRNAAPAKLSHVLRLVFDESYVVILPEAIRVIDLRGLLFPPDLLPPLLDFAAAKLSGQPDLAQRALSVGGHRAAWLAGLNPDWAHLGRDNDFAAAFQLDPSPAGKRDILQRWRSEDPAAARAALAAHWKGQSPKNQETLLAALQTGLSEADTDWLRQQLTPKRKGVRRAVLRLLLLAGDVETTDELINLTAAALTEQGRFVNITQFPEGKETIARYGGLRTKESLGEYLLNHLPPTTLPDLLGQTPGEYWNNLTKTELNAAATAIVTYRDAHLKEAFLSYALLAPREKLPISLLTELTATLPQEGFERVFHQYLESEREGFSSGSLAPLLAVMRKEPWSERVTKAFVLSIVQRVRDSRSLAYTAVREQAELWKRATPLVHVDTFAFLRQHLHAMTERPDQIGKLSLEMLQLTAFRRVLYDA